jgi:NAD-dependent deacetylase
VRLEQGLAQRGGSLFLCTQNIDDLHERAGSSRVVHMHGELLKARCIACGTVHQWRSDLGPETACPACASVGSMRPDVVWFGEMSLAMDEITDALYECDYFVAVGTSGSVYPAAGFVSKAQEQGITTCEINLEPSENARLFDDRRYGPASEVLPLWVDEMLQWL